MNFCSRGGEEGGEDGEWRACLVRRDVLGVLEVLEARVHELVQTHLRLLQPHHLRLERAHNRVPATKTAVTIRKRQFGVLR